MKNKTLSVIASCILLFATSVPLTLAADFQHISDVENLSAEALLDANSVRLTWDAVADADRYTIYYGTQSISDNSAGYENDILVENVTTYTVEDLDPGTKYYFAVAADDSTGTYFGSYSYSKEKEVEVEVSMIITDDSLGLGELEISEALIAETEEVLTADSTDSLNTPLGDTPSSLDTLLEDYHPAASINEPAELVEELPQSGPATAALVFTSGIGAYFWRKFKKSE